MGLNQEFFTRNLYIVKINKAIEPNRINPSPTAGDDAPMIPLSLMPRIIQ